MADALSRAEAFQRSQARPAGAGEVMAHLVPVGATGEAIGSGELVRADAIAASRVFQVVPTVGRYAMVVDPRANPAAALEVAHQVMSASNPVLGSLVERIVARHPEWDRALSSAARARELMGAERASWSVPSEVGAVGTGGARRFQVDEVIGSGAYGVVALARDMLLAPQRLDVAIKFVKVRDPAGLTALLTEARLACLVQHPCAVRVLDAGECEGGLGFIAFERVRGTPIVSHLAAEREFHPEHVALAVADLADALGSLHELGFAHGDLSAANVLIDQDGRLRVIDYGTTVPADEDAVHRDCICMGELMELLLRGFVARAQSPRTIRLSLGSGVLGVAQTARWQPTNLSALAAALRSAVDRARIIRYLLSITATIALFALLMWVFSGRAG